jgi:hypothetical protein
VDDIRVGAARELVRAFDMAMRSSFVEVRVFGCALALRVGPLLRGEIDPPEFSVEEMTIFAGIIEEDEDEG